MNRRIFYFCRINTEQCQREHPSDSIHIGPAYKKVMSVASALRHENSFAWVVTAPVANIRRRSMVYRGLYFRERGVPVHSLSYVGRPILDRMLSSIEFAKFAILKIKKTDRVVLYNYFPEYLLAAIALRLKGNPAIIDVEDAPRTDERNFRGVVNWISFHLNRFVCARRYIGVSNSNSERFGLKPSEIIYGVARSSSSIASHSKFSEERVRVLYGGTLIKDTGLELFLDALKLLSSIENWSFPPIEFLVTGFFDPSKFSEVKSRLHDSKHVSLRIFDELSLREYEELLATADVGLCLKLPDTQIGDSTFPSKVVEISVEGLLLITTSVSDVPTIFSSGQALFLRTNDPQGLVDALLAVLSDKEAARTMAKEGQKAAVEAFSAESIARKLVGICFT